VGIFSIFKGSKVRDDKKIAKGLAVIKNAKAIKEDRGAWIEYFKGLDDADAAVPALLQRFEYSLEHGINDTREKESCMNGIVAFGDAALPYVTEHLLTTSRIAWPIKILKALGKEDQVIEILLSALDFGEISFDQGKVDKNYDILCYLVEYKLAGRANKLAHFVADQDERVRFACVELLIEQDDPEIPGLVEKFIGDGSPENTRIRQAVIEAFLKHGWVVQDRARFPGGQVIDRLYVNDSGRLEIRR